MPSSWFNTHQRRLVDLSGDPKLNMVGFNTLQLSVKFGSDPKPRAKLSGNPKSNTVGSTLFREDSSSSLVIRSSTQLASALFRISASSAVIPNPGPSSQVI